MFQSYFWIKLIKKRNELFGTILMAAAAAL